MILPMSNFWKKLKKPIMVLAPMADVTDAAFRHIITKYGKPHVTWTEFTSVDGLCSVGKSKLLINFKYSENERPIVAQLFGANPEKMFKAGRLVKKLGFDGLDINMGCPDRSILKQGAGGATIKNLKLALEIIESARKGTEGLPISVKTRIGFGKDTEFEKWITGLLGANLSALTIHARTVKELSKVPARWEFVRRAVEIRNQLGVETLILGNGDVMNLAEARKRVEETGCDGVMLGRAIFGNPWLFTERTKLPGVKEKLTVLVEHVKLFEKYFKNKKNFDVMKKHFKAYVSGFEGAKELRVSLMECKNAKEVEKILKPLL